MFEASAPKTIAFSSNTVPKDHVSEGWKTYNFEVQIHHTYIANGNWAHNDSILSKLTAYDTLIALNDELTDADQRWKLAA